MLDKIISFSIKNKFVIGLFSLALVVWGVWSATKLPIDAVPDITNNQVQIITSCPTLAGQEVEQLVTSPIERSISNLPDIVELRSISRFGLSVVTVVFEDEVDIYFARQIINECLKEAESKIPSGMGTPELAPVSTGLGEVYQYIIHPKKGSENKYSAMDLRTMQDWIVARQLYGTKGIAEINSFGGQLKQYEVSVNPEKLLAMNVSLAELFLALEKNNENTGGAYIDKKPNAYFIRGIGLVSSFDDIRNIVVKNNGNGVPILIKDVAEVRFGSALRYGAMTYNGEKDVVGGVIMMLKGANSAEVVDRVKEKMPLIQKSLPEDVIIEPYLDRRDLVDRAISTVETNLIEGALIVIFVLVLFLGNLRAGLIVASAIPLAMLFALALMNVFGVSANLMSLGAIDFGLIVDGAVIIVEATMHHLGVRKSMARLSQSDMDEEVLHSAIKIRSSAAFGEIIILIVYIPILTLIGIEGKMFRPMAQTVGFAIIGALVLSLTYIPMMCALFLPKKVSHKVTLSDKMMSFFQRLYSPAFNRVFAWKKTFVGITILLFLSATAIFSKMGGEFIPTLNEGDFAFHCILPQGTSLSQSIETSMQAMRLLKEFDEVKMTVGKTGSAEVPTDPMPPEATDMMVLLKAKKEWKREISYDALADEMAEKLESIPGVFFEKNQPIQMRFNELMTGVRQDVAIKIFGEDLDSLLVYGNKVGGIVQSVDGATEPMVERVEGLPQIVIRYNRAQIANYGIAIEDINHLVSTAFAGGAAGVVFENERRFDLVVRFDSIHRASIDDVGRLFITAGNGKQIPLSQVAEIKLELGPAQISREGGKRRIVIGFNVADRDVASVVHDIQDKLNTFKLPEGYYFSYGGTFENLQAASKRLMVALPVALVLIFMLLYFTFASLKQAVLIFTAIPMSAIGGVFALLLRDMPFSISAGIGFIALFGVAVLNGIVLIGTFNQLEKDGITDVLQRIKMGTSERLRPVLMTATVASLGFFPMAFSHGAGAEVQKPLATVVIGGLITATFLTLFVIPILYYFFSRKKVLSVNAGAVTVLLFLLGGYNASAQTAKPMSADEAVATALKNNLAIQAQSLSVSAAEKLKLASFELPKADVNIQYGQYNSIHKDFGFNLSQSIPFPTLFAARAGLYEAQLQNKRLYQQAAGNELRAQVLLLYKQIQYTQAVAAKVKQLDSAYGQLAAAAALRYKTGEAGLLEKTTAETKAAQLQLLVLATENESKSLTTQLASLLQLKSELSVESLPIIPLSPAGSMDTSLINSNPGIQAGFQQAVLIQKEKGLETAQLLPDITIGYFNQSLIGLQNIGGQDVFFDRSKRFTGINAGISIPLTFFSNVSKVQALNLEQQAAVAQASNDKQILQTKLLGNYQKYLQLQAAYASFQTKELPNAKVILQTASTSYKSGSIGYLEYIQALETVTEIELNYLQIINSINEAVITINYLTNK